MLARLRNLWSGGRREAGAVHPAAAVIDTGAAAALIHAHRAAEAVTLLRDALAHTPGDAQAWLWLARALSTCGRTDEALDAYAEAADLAAPAQVALVRGEWARARGDLAEAIGELTRALEARPADPDLRNQLSLAQEAAGDAAAAERTLADGLAHHPASQMLWNNLAGVKLRHAGFEAAARCYDEALRALPGDPVIRYNFAVTCAQQGQAARAAALYRASLALDPAFGSARLNLAMTLYQTGELAEGCRLFEERWDLAESLRDSYLHDRARQWRGEPLDGRRILLWSEQGLGDSLLMIRYAPLLAARGARHVHVQVQPALLPLFDGMPGVDAWSRADEPVDASAFDLHCPLMSLPFCFRTTEASIPVDLPYLRAPAERVARWQARLPRRPGHRLAGLAWSSGVWGDQTFAKYRHAKSVPLAACQPLTDLPRIDWVSLQVGPGRDELLAAPDAPLMDFADEIRDFADTAAIVECLDFVVSVDTSVGHLASACARPTVLLQKFDGAQFWLSGRDDSLWYPRVQRVARQDAAGDWDSAVAKAVAIVDNLTRTGSLWSSGHP